jgi:hypothetical protein
MKRPGRLNIIEKKAISNDQEEDDRVDDGRT